METGTKTGKLTPEGEPDPSVFSTEFNREGIQVGTAIALMVRKERHQSATGVEFRHLWGKTKRQQLVESLLQDRKLLYETVIPAIKLGLPFRPMEVDANYTDWPLLPELFPASFPGVQTSRDSVVVDIDRKRLEDRMQSYFNPALAHEQIRQIIPDAMKRGARFDPIASRNQLMKRGFLPDKLVRHSYRPFDTRWLYWEPETKLLDEKRPEYFPQAF